MPNTFSLNQYMSYSCHTSLFWVVLTKYHKQLANHVVKLRLLFAILIDQKIFYFNNHTNEKEIKPQTSKG